MNLRAKLVALVLGVVAFACLGVAIVTHVSVANEVNQQVDERLERTVSRFDNFDGPKSDPRPTSSTKPGPGFLGAPGQGEYALGVISQDGSTIAGGYIDQHGQTQSLSSADLEKLAALDTSSENQDISLEIGDYRVAVTDSGNGVTSIAGININDMKQTLLRLDLTLLGVSLVVLTATGLLGAFLVRRTMEPLGEVVLAANAVASTPLAHGDVEPIARVRPSVAERPDEVGIVAKALNTMLDNVDYSLQQRHSSELKMRRFVADASHELRTPLTSVRGYADLVRLSGSHDANTDMAIERILSNTDRMSVLVEDLLLLARLDQDEAVPKDAPVSQFDLGEILVEAVMDAQVISPDHHFELDIPEAALDMRADVSLVERLITNVVSNARKHTAPGTRVKVTAQREGNAHIVQISDTGEGMPQELVETIFDRFTRGDMSRTGKEGSSGLGMSIAKAVTERQGGSISVDSALGQGTTVRITLPIEPPA